MRIRRNAARTLGSAASAAAPLLDAAPQSDLLKTPPPPHLAPCSARESRGGGSFSSLDSASGKCCDFNRSCWDVIDELDGSDPQTEDELLDKYLVHATSWLFSAIVPAVSAEKKELAADTAQLQPEAKKNAKIKQEEGGAELWSCKKNDGKGWRCPRKVSRPDSLCDYHFVQQRYYWNPDFALTMEEGTAKKKKAPLQAALKPSTGSKQPRKKKKKASTDFNATEGFYYYAGFGFRSKRHCRSSSVDDSVPTKQEEEEDSIKKEEEQEQPKDSSHPSQVEADEGHGDDQTAARGDAPICDDDISGIAGADEVSSDNDCDEICVAGSSMDGNGDPQASNGGSERKIRRKPVKARSIMSLM
ncbi:unnamed protein product [Urochloa decumbens]|uniref:WRC domain-containing protein n=1 Tax=Urochloa decumbens TaxID=240449 RepID=A0ABC8XZQ5_9POAL